MNKNKIKILAGTLFLSAFLVSTCSKPPETPVANKVETQAYKSVGVVKSIDPQSGKVMVDHEDIPGYMAPMEMSEPVADAAMLSQVKPGDKVEFEILREGSKVKYTKFNKIGEVVLIDAPAIYAASCAECHGDKGQGAPKGIPFTSGHALDHSEADFIKTVTNGKAKKKDKEMPAFQDRLKAEEIAAVVKFVREVIQKDLQRNEGHKH